MKSPFTFLQLFLAILFQSNHERHHYIFGNHEVFCGNFLELFGTFVRILNTFYV